MKSRKCISLFIISISLQIVTSSIIINELDYGKNDFLELYNTGSSSIDLTGYYVLFANTSGTIHNISLPSQNFTSQSFFIICKNQQLLQKYSINCNINLQWDENSKLLLSSIPSGISVSDGNTVLDKVSYRGSLAFFTEGNSIGVDDLADDAGFSRIPNGQDSNNNNVDFKLRCISPGKSNVDITDCSTEVFIPQTSQATIGPMIGILAAVFTGAITVIALVAYIVYKSVVLIKKRMNTEEEAVELPRIRGLFTRVSRSRKSSKADTETPVVTIKVEPIKEEKKETIPDGKKEENVKQPEKKQETAFKPEPKKEPSPKKVKPESESESSTDDSSATEDEGKGKPKSTKKIYVKEKPETPQKNARASQIVRLESLESNSNSKFSLEKSFSSVKSDENLLASAKADDQKEERRLSRRKSSSFVGMEQQKIPVKKSPSFNEDPPTKPESPSKGEDRKRPSGGMKRPKEYATRTRIDATKMIEKWESVSSKNLKEQTDNENK